MITIPGLTPEQVQICDQLWALNSFDELLEFRESQPPNLWPTIDLMAELIMIECVDQQIETQQECDQARSILVDKGLL